MISKRIFYMWCGSTKPADVNGCIQSWREKMPKYEYIEINETNCEYFDFEQQCLENDFFRYVYQNKMWAYVADYVRFFVLYKFGGIWLDTDVQILKSLDDFLSNKLFLGCENFTHIETAIIGAEKENIVLKDILNFYNDEIWQSELYSSPRIMSYILTKYGFSGGSDKILQLKNDVIIYPPKYFYPYKLNSVYSSECLTKNSYAIHWWKASWGRPEFLEWLKNKHLRGKEKSLKIILHPYCKLYLFGFLPIGKYYKLERKINIFNVLFLNIKLQRNKSKIMLFNIIPLLKWR